MFYANEIKISGNIGNEVQRIETKNGGAFYKASVAHTRLDKKTNAKTTFWFDVLAFGEQGQMLKAMSKGDRVVAHGRLDVKVTEYENKRYTNVTVWASEIHPVEKRIVEPKMETPPADDPNFDVPF